MSNPERETCRALTLVTNRLDGLYSISIHITPCPDARERAGPVFSPVGEEETQAQRCINARRTRGLSI